VGLKGAKILGGLEKFSNVLMYHCNMWLTLVSH